MHLIAPAVHRTYCTERSVCKLPTQDELIRRMKWATKE